MNRDYITPACYIGYQPNKLMPQSQSDFHNPMEYAPIDGGAFNLRFAMIGIPLSQGKVALIDDEDYEKVSKHRWHAVKNGTTWYAITNIKISGKYTTQRLHRFLLNAPPNFQVDHWNGDGLYNLKSNLRMCTRSQNQQNRRRIWGVSKYKGVHRNGCGWSAQLQMNRKQIWLGTFKTRIEAAEAYDMAALKYFGEFACTNEML